MRGPGRGIGVLFSMFQTAVVLTALALVAVLGALGVSAFYPDLRCPAAGEKADWRYIADAVNPELAPAVPLASAEGVSRYLAAHPGCCTLERRERPGFLARVAAAQRGEDPASAAVLLRRHPQGAASGAPRAEAVLFDLCGQLIDPE